MWTKTVEINFQKQRVQVMVFLSDTTEDANDVVTTQSMVNEFFLIEKVIFENRDAAYDYIKHYTAAMAKAFVNRTAYTEGAMH